MTLDQIRIERLEKIIQNDRISARSGSIPGKGTYRCQNCSVKWLLEDYEDLPECPECQGADFEKEPYNQTI